MPIPQATTDLLNAIDADTNVLADLVPALRALIKTGMSQAEVDQVNTTLTAFEGRLRGIAADPDQPVPPGPVVTMAKKK